MSKKYLGGLFAIALCSVGFYFLIPVLDSYYPNSTNVEEENIQPQQAAIVNLKEPAPKPPQLLYGIPIDSMIVIEDKIRRNQNISEILSDYNISAEKIFHLAKLSKEVFDVRHIAANKKYTLICSPDSLKTAQALIYEHNPVEYVVFNLQDSMAVVKKQKEVKLIERAVSGVIQSSLAVTMSELGLSPQLTNNFVDVLAWQIDFFRLQPGDKFKVIYEDKMVEGESIGTGDINAIYFQHMGNDYYAFHYDQGSGIDYFDENGKSLKKALKKYPLDFTRISSRYSGNRYHPVQKRWKAHRGTDFAAPKGTPIKTVGDGIIVEARYSKYNGNYVKVRHNSTYTTQYLHMSKIASGIKPGVRVKQDQTIGYVGSTGLATGNHLCYRFWKNGVQVDALKVDLPSSEPVHEDKMVDFTMKRNVMLNKLDQIHFKEEEQILAKAG